MASLQFHWADYLVFVAVLFGSALFGVIIGFLGRRGKTSTTRDFVKGGGNMSALPVALSTVASFLSAPSILGSPAEVYIFGTMWVYSTVGYILSVPIMVFLLLPVYHKMNFTSAYEYLEERFNKYVRLLGSVTFIIMMFLYLAVSIYAPASAFSQVTGMELSFSVMGVGLICIFYTTVGGMKAAIYVDTFQMMIILAGLIGLTGLGLNEVGGFSTVWETASSGNRLEFDNFNTNPTERHSFWALSIGLAVMTMSILGANQAMIQRFLTIKKIVQVQLSILYALIVVVVYTIIVVFLGLVMYAYYQKCDPMTNEDVSTSTQMLPLFVMQMLGHLPGLPGLFSAAVFSASLSTVSAGIMGLAAVLVVDFVKPGLLRFKNKPLGAKATVWTLRGFTLLTGAIVIGMAYLTPFLGPTLLQIALSVLGMVGGPMLGIFTLGIFLPFVNSAGALVGGLTSFALTFWVSIGAIVQPKPLEPLPVRVDGCIGSNTSDIANMTTLSPHLTTIVSGLDESGDNGGALASLYGMSYLYYALFGLVVCWVVGIPIALLTGCNKNRKLNPNLVCDYKGLCGSCCTERNPIGKWWFRPFGETEPKDFDDREDEYDDDDYVADCKNKADEKVGKDDALPAYSPYAKNGDVSIESGNGSPAYYDIMHPSTHTNPGFLPDDIIATKL